MKQTLQLRVGQQLTMTPQLQQAIKLLQLSAVELQQEVARALEDNPLLEQEEQDPTTELKKQSTENDFDYDDENRWDAYIHGNSSTQGAIDIENEQVYQGQTTENLTEYLFWQMRLTPFSPVDESIATTIIDAISDSGYLQTSLEDILNTLHKQGEETVTLAEIETVLKRIQHFDPIGVGARNVQECLLIQLEQIPKGTCGYNIAQIIIQQHIDLLAVHDLRNLQRQLGVQDEPLKQALRLIQSLEPRPGNLFVQTSTSYVIPDIIVRKINGAWQAQLNPEALPKVRVNQSYVNMIERSNQPKDHQFIRTHVQEARWFLKSLESRNETLIKVSQCIIDRQQAFLEQGEEAMTPLVLNDVAQAVEMHESTISRVTTQKYMHTPRGTFELKYFFSSQVPTQAGQGCSSTAIRALIRKLVASENPEKPLSDNKITDLLSAQGIIVARRTIAKYREALFIPPSNQRKRLT